MSLSLSRPDARNDSTQRTRRGIVPRRGRRFRLDRGRNLGHDMLNLARVLRMGRFEREADGLRGRGQQLQEMMARNFRPRTDGLRQFVVASRSA